MLQYKQEFGEGFELGFELNNFPFLQDKSWHNDVCPSFMFKAKKDSSSSGLTQRQQDEQYLVLWVDYENEDARENTGSSRYTVISATATRFSASEWDVEINHDADSVTVFESEDSQALTQYLSTLFILETS